MNQKAKYEQWAAKIRAERPTTCECCGGMLPTGNNSGLQIFFWVTETDELKEMFTCRECKPRAYQIIGQSNQRIGWQGEDLSGNVSLFQVEPK